MIYVHAYGLAFLELTFVIVSLMLLHSLKQTIGTTGFYLSLGATFVFAQFVTAAGMNISHVYPGLNVNIGPTIFFTPLMAALLITYIVDGTTETQRLIVGIMAMVGIFAYFSVLSETQTYFPGYNLSPYVPKSFIGPIFESGRNLMMASLLSFLVVFLVLPVVYQLLRNRNIGLNVSVFGALIFSEVLDAFFYELVTNYPSDEWWDGLRFSYLTRAIAMIWVSILTTIYLNLRNVHDRNQSDSRSTLDIITAFLGSYGQAKRLQANVREWEGRYRMVVENTNDLIFLVDQSGIVLDANKIVLDMLGYNIDELSTIKIQSLIKINDVDYINWNEIIDSFNPDENNKDFHYSGHEWKIETQKNEKLLIDATLSQIEIQQNKAILLVARNITQRKILEKERESLQTQLIDSQRMEAVGKLAGGIAHDYNNLLHAIQGSIDMLESIVTRNPKAKELTANISTAVKRASTLTGQLLGFARGGKYKVVEIDIADLIEQTARLFRPILGKKNELKVAVHPDMMAVEGDFTQLEQVLLNILLNAKGAIEDDQGIITFRAEPALDITPGWREIPQKRISDSLGRIGDIRKTTIHNLNINYLNQQLTKTTNIGKKQITSDFIVIRIGDNGCGMTHEIKERIFEPFFTIKKNKGTGMGLAMAYGCVENHNGWIHVESEIGKGSEFFIFLPRLK